MSEKTVKRVIDNVEQTVPFFVASIAPGEIPEDCRMAAGDYNMLLNKQVFRASNGDDFIEEFYEDEEAFDKKLKEFKNLMDRTTPDWLRQMMDKYKVDNIGDKLDVLIKTSDVLFDIYLQSVPQPTAPLAKALHDRKLQDIAQKLSADKLSVPDEIYDIVEDVLSDEEKWAKISFSCYIVDRDGNKHPMSLTNKGVTRFGKVMHQVIHGFIPPEIDETQVNKIEQE